MSEISVEPIPSTEAPGATRSRAPAWYRWPKRILVFLVLLWIATQGTSLAIQHTRLRGILTAQFEAAMGRPVEVASYHLSFWDGPVVQARSVIVGEDPRFGAEYFLRTDSMDVRLRWRSLLRGRLEFGTISLTHPSLNLVRSSDGEWNLAEWLPRPSPPRPRGFAGPIAPSASTRFQRIEIDGGRINFKISDEKLPFAFVGVTGAVETNGPGRWRLNLQATPWRAAVVLQQAGTIQVSGNVGGTSSRLRPAAIEVTWAGVSLPDVLRLVHNEDFGLRGALLLSVDARTDDSNDGWVVSSRAALERLHRWDLGLRPDNPSLNVVAQLAWRPSAPYIELAHAAIEAPHSVLHVNGRLYWSRQASQHAVPPAQVVLSSSQVDTSDLLAWARAFHSGIADSLSVRGLAFVDATVSTWPPRLVHAELSSNGIDVFGEALGKPARVGRFNLLYDGPNERGNGHGLTSFGPVSISWGSTPAHPDGSFRLENAAGTANRAFSIWHVAGSTNQVRDLITGASAFGWNVAGGWDLAGPFSCDLRWQPTRGARFLDELRQPFGWMDFGAPASASDGAVLRAPFLNLPIEQIKARVDFRPGVRQARLTSAQAFGANWRGKFERQNPWKAWQFDLLADRLTSADLDRWLNPRWRESFFDRMLPFLNSRPGMSGASENLQADGRLSVGRFVLSPLVVSDLQTEIAMEGRHFTLTNATAQFYGGQVKGSFEANLQPTPSYHADLDFSHVDVSALLAATPSLAGFSAESVGGQISFDARGSTRADLLASLICQGDARFEGPALQNVRFSGAASGSSALGSVLRFSSGSAKFSCGQRTIQFQQLLLQAPDSTAEGSGTIDFSRNVDVRLEMVSATPASGSPAAPTMHLAGTLPALQAAQVSSTAPRRAR
ncbi:MAG TPA: AsmA family protein [Candidatus Acidoferrum sp.]|nr:AsmA family protein [Candidatus Acidoferrum sp.]